MQLAIRSRFGLHHPARNQLAEDRSAGGITPQEFHRSRIANVEAIEEGGDRVASHHPFLCRESLGWGRLVLQSRQLDHLLDPLAFEAGHVRGGRDAERGEDGQSGKGHQGNADDQPGGRREALR